MATNIPAKLKTADIGRFAQRAVQLEKIKPAIAYWCEYWVVNQLIARGLHNTDEECLTYTTNLMDKLEETKSKHANDDAIIDDAAGQAYVEQFGLETFERADRTVRANKVTKQTADTFLAASTFLELLNIWGEVDPEVQKKIRYAKWNAVRIVRDIKEGKDPNESNPISEPEPDEGELQPLDPNDPEVQQLSGEPSKPQQPTVEDAPDEQDRLESRLAKQSTLDHSLHPSAQHSTQVSPGPPGPRHSTYADNEVSPMDPSPNPRNGSVGGGYFPEVPTFTSDTRPSHLPTAPANQSGGPIPDLPDPSQLPPPGITSPQNPIPFVPPSVHDPTSSPQDFYTRPPQPQPHQYIPPVVPQPVPAVAPPPAVAQPSGNQTLNTDDVAVAKAQKHARWAISALNFEDVNTAVKELRNALQTLGAQ